MRCQGAYYSKDSKELVVSFRSMFERATYNAIPLHVGKDVLWVS
jgi:hypothetical protein